MTDHCLRVQAHLQFPGRQLTQPWAEWRGVRQQVGNLLMVSPPSWQEWTFVLLRAEERPSLPSLALGQS